MSDASFSVVFFAVSNDAGAELARLFTELVGSEFGLAVRVIEGATQTDLHRACLNDDIVVFDASVEEGHNYAAATAQPMVLDKVLVVSRTYLPLNFYGLREGGAPNYPEPAFQTNETILAWLYENVGELLRGDAGHKPARKGLIGYFLAIKESLDIQQRRWLNRGRIFISYRSRHCEQVEELTRRIQSGAVRQVPPSSVRFLRPGELVYEDEVLTKFRHWQLASSIDRKIGAAEEMWVYATEDYLASWWTRAELATIAYRLACNVSAPRVRLYDPATDSLRDLPEGWLPSMNHEQKRRMARWYSNTDQGTMGIESVPIMRLYAKLPLLNRIKYFNDPVWDEDFWEDLLLPCVTCRHNSPPIERLDLDSFLWLREPYLVRLTPEQLEESVKQGYLHCPVCQTTYENREAPNPRLLWMPTRYGRPTGPDGASLVALPVYRVSKRALLRKRRTG
jgi:hypothetical protein